MSDKHLETKSWKRCYREARSSKKESCNGHQKKYAGPLPSAVQDRDVGQRWKCELLRERNSERIGDQVLAVTESQVVNILL